MKLSARTPPLPEPAPDAPSGPRLSPEQRVEEMVRDRLYGRHMRWNVEPAVPRQGSSTILPSFPPAAKRS
jgi:hypothetical protein